MTIGFLFLVPLTGMARVDVFSGRHALLFAPATWRHGLAGVIIGIAVCYIITFVVNALFGRLFCGWGCPIGFLNRLADVADLDHDPAKTARWRILRDRIGPWGHSLLLTLACLFWWTSPAVFVQGSPRALACAWGSLLVGSLTLGMLGRYARWSFCVKACPVGLYYSFVAPGERFGIHFHPRTVDGTKEACLHCNACINVCPVSLDPMNLDRHLPARGGISIADVPGANHCLKCGDCIQACELMIDKSARRRGITDVPLTLGSWSVSVQPAPALSTEDSSVAAQPTVASGTSMASPHSSDVS